MKIKVEGKSKSALRGQTQRLGLAFLACALVPAKLGTKQPFAHWETPLLRLSFRRMPNSEHPYSPKMEPS